MMTDVEVNEALDALKAGSMSRTEALALARLALLSLRETRRKLREYRDRELIRIEQR